MSDYADLRARIENREVIILDGAIGTQLQRMEVPMSHDAWAAIALETHPFTVRRLHELYIDAGVRRHHHQHLRERPAQPRAARPRRQGP